MNIAAVVVTYNRIELLKQCIRALRNQTRKPDEIFVINNNSTDGTSEWLTEQNDITTINQENLGGAGGFYTGIKIAYEKGYDWIWCMDDDSQPLDSALLISLPIAKDNKIAVICSAVYDLNMNLVTTHRGFFNFKKKLPFLLYKSISEELIKKDNFIRIDFASFVGILINRLAIEEIGLPKKEFFIHNDDVEYSIRLRNFGPIILLPESKIIHQESTFEFYSVKKRFIHRISYRIPYDKFWITLYSMRNYVWLTKKQFKPAAKAFFYILHDFMILIRGIILYDDLKFKRIKLLAIAFIDGYRGVFNNNKHS